jgi:sulfotransferase
MKKLYFMAGLPRSGSTVLSSILNQNPKIHSGPSSPVLSTMYMIENHLHNDELFYSYPKIEQGKKIISSIMAQYYSDRNEEIIIDKNRAWPLRVDYIENYLETDAKIICPVRSVEDILCSMIRMIRRNPYKEGQDRINFIDEQLVKLNISINDDNRCNFIMGPQGILGQSLKALSDCISSGYSDKILLVEYNALTHKPQEVFERIYSFLGEDSYNHNFNDIKNTFRERDLETYGIEDMHKVRKTLSYTYINPKEILSEEILGKCKELNFWRK